MLTVNRRDPKPIWQQLLDQAIANITNGHWRPGEQLIPSRELAQQLGVSRSTVQLVYEELRARGYIDTSRRGGTRVTSCWTIDAPSPPQRLECPVIPSIPVLRTSIGRLEQWFKGEEAGEAAIDFSPHEPYVDDTFQKLWRQAFLQASSGMHPCDWAYGNAYGYQPLREQIQRHLSHERGIHVRLDQILLTSGAQHGIDLIAQALLVEGDTVAIEDPGYPAAGLAMNYRRLRVLPVPVDDQGLVVGRMPPGTKLAFVTPSHQCAAGVVMAEPRRQQLLRWATSNRSWIVEDDYDSEFRYHGEPLPTLFSQAPNHTIYVMSFSKMIAPALRLAALVGSAEAIAQLASVQMLSNRHLPIMESVTLARFMEQGHFLRHMRRVRILYRRRYETIIKSIHACGLSARLTITGIQTGAHILLEAEPSFDERQVTAELLRRGVRVYPLSPYCMACDRRGLVLGFAKVDERLIEEGIRILADVCMRT
ncbi:PLP-dependent aminotransferase family protein [Paenibacillus sp. GCM10023250]|uniref:MocR-like pyridoxine biosynthesis transcription factor PdxR n=1 Tax=Paenibacillus sp. GCM10023250 TaxID=3252648 RepID=UPI00361C82B9